MQLTTTSTSFPSIPEYVARVLDNSADALGRAADDYRSIERARDDVDPGTWKQLSTRILKTGVLEQLQYASRSLDDALLGFAALRPLELGTIFDLGKHALGLHGTIERVQDAPAYRRGIVSVRELGSAARTARAAAALLR